MKETTDYERKQEELTWLENLQLNSWEPEVIISGITLAFLFVFPAKIYEFSVYLIQEVGVGYLPSLLILFYLTTVVSVFKIFFVVHLCLRFVWAGLLGLSYAFPEGVINQNLFKIAQGYNYQKPADMVLRLEKICSMTFAYPVSLVLMFLMLTVYFGFLIAIYIWFDLNLLTLSIIILLSLAAFFTLVLGRKKTKLKIWYSESMLSSISAIYQSNLGKWLAVVYAILIFAFSVPIIISDTDDFSMFSNDRGLIEKELEWPGKHLHFQSDHVAGSRFPRSFIPREELDDDYMKLGIARYEGDGKIITALNTEFISALDSMKWQPIQETADLHRVYIDEQLVPIETWSKHRIGGTKQKIYQTGIDISNLAEGTHTLRVEKLLLKYGFIDNQAELITIEHWDQFEFIKR
ncbi:hypothetical protein PBT90_18170 [Algoriphagus halophytocola]|uniref:ABC transporter permease n=1 Tax=Algoriphagus halophytocola TaxID=2991499 RepID=A0ABY6MCL5_9BACT|nr:MULTISPECIES: hypothetical protein [unclassified Algoriphagus]UZD21443.1 hypothetical protein OM944_12300 [Algoriphagus sp. TR-M5]WBL42655.1 hypothetical protein PBT90_18170 [Algoriphagus sp. TR-M9]